LDARPAGGDDDVAHVDVPVEEEDLPF